MNTARFIHQQVFQLKWHLLACLGLAMVLPVEETVVSLFDRDGMTFASALISLWLSPLLTALIACANVQADLDEKRDLFWRSKPVSVRRFMTGKFIIGLVLSMIILACPCLWMLIGASLSGTQLLEGQSLFAIFCISLVLLLSYSLCFFCNVLIRKTARAWIMGLAATCFVLLIPFVLPINAKYVSVDLFNMSRILWVYLVLILGFAVLSFVGAILAVQNNWRIHTKLRGLLWGGSALVFATLLLFCQQIANVKILDEKPLEWHVTAPFLKKGEKVFLGSHYGVSKKYEINAGHQKIELKEMPPVSEGMSHEVQMAYSQAPKFESHPGYHFGDGTQKIEIHRSFN